MCQGRIPYFINIFKSWLGLNKKDEYDLTDYTFHSEGNVTFFSSNFEPFLLCYEDLSVVVDSKGELSVECPAEKEPLL